MYQRLAVTILASLLAASTLAGSFVVGVETTDYLPIYKGEGGNYNGYARDLLDAFASKYGHQFSYKSMPIARLFDEFAGKKSLDFKFPDNPLWQPDLKKGVTISYSASAISVTEGLLVLPANKGKALDAVKTISTLRGFTPWPYMDKVKAGAIKLNEANTADAAILMGTNGRVDGVYMSTISANYIMTEMLHKPGTLTLDEKLPTTKSDFSLASIAHPEVIKQFNEFLVKEKVLVNSLKAKYGIKE